jgi:6-phosphogluconate dehydrogenase
MTVEEADFGLIGLAVMGQNLVLNIADHGFSVAVFNRTVEKVDRFIEGPAKGKEIVGTHSLQEFVSKLKRPRKIMLMVKAGPPVDEFIEHLLPHLQKGDIIIDGGNSHFPDTERRCQDLKAKGILYMGTGISGGEEGARHGPSIMPGGNREAWPQIKPIFQAIAAKADDGTPCCDWVGDGGAGHYVKMVHNGIEYGDMQLISEAYDLMRRGLGFSLEELADAFHEWNQGDLDSYLIEITAQIMKFKESGNYLLDVILDVAGQKGTGKWTVYESLEQGVPVTLIAEAVFARTLSGFKDDRIALSEKFPKGKKQEKKEHIVAEIGQALYLAKILSYTQGFMLMRAASDKFKWDLQYGSIAMMWRGGCIIRSKFLNKIKEAYDKKSDLISLLFDDYFAKEIEKSEGSFRKAMVLGIQMGIPMPCFSAAMSFFDGMTSKTLPANLVQAQRDFFGAHTYERVDKPRGEFFHTNWTGKGGDVSSSSYNA